MRGCWKANFWFWDFQFGSNKSVIRQTVTTATEHIEQLRVNCCKSTFARRQTWSQNARMNLADKLHNHIALCTYQFAVCRFHIARCSLQFAPERSLAAHWSQTQSRKKPESRETPLNWVEDSSKNISFTGASKSQNSLHRWRARLCTLRWSSLKRRQKIWGQEWKKGDGKYGSQSEGNRIPECIALQVSLCKSTRVKSKLLGSSSSFRGGAFTSLHLTFHN